MVRKRVQATAVQERRLHRWSTGSSLHFVLGVWVCPNHDLRAEHQLVSNYDPHDGSTLHSIKI